MCIMCVLSINIYSGSNIFPNSEKKMLPRKNAAVRLLRRLVIKQILLISTKLKQ